MANSGSVEKVRLFALGSGWGVPFPTGAPFPLKLATWMRMADVPFEVVVENNPGKGPKGKSPWIEHGDVRMGDSTLIIEHLARERSVDLDRHLDPTQRATAVAIQRMLEEHYHQCFEHQLFFGEGGEERGAEFAASLPVPLRWIILPLFKRAFAKQLHARGMGRHPEEVIIAQGKADLDALDALLGEGPYFFGDRPSAIDACVFGFLGVTVYVKGDNPLFGHAAGKKNLLRYCERMRKRYFPETLEALPLLVSDLEVAAPASGSARAPVRDVA
jgi:glutathione S-transferase